jgi:hypothetical protein
MKNQRVLLLMVFCFTILAPSYAQTQTASPSNIPSANEFTAYRPYTGRYSYGLNPGWYYYVAPDGSWVSNWGTQNLIDLGTGNASKGVKGVGAKTYRMKVTDEYLTLYGQTSLLPDYQYLQSIGAKEIAAFVGEPSAADRLDTLFPGASEKSKVFKGMYEPIWLDAAQTQINPANTFAKYLYNAVKTYGDYITFWEIVNEPDFTYGSGGWLGDMNPPAAGSWFDHDPTPADLVNLQAPVQYYIRLLRISWEVIKKLQPNDYICTGGIGNRSFLAALLRNTDNPNGGKVTPEFPLKAGAYFDVLSFHTYPEFSWDVKHWDNSIGGQLYNRHSDAAVSGHFRYKNNMDSLLRVNGYNGVQYPAKQFICTETGMSRVMDNDNVGSNEIQRNYMMKAHVKTQMDGQIKQTYWFQTADGTTAPDHWGQFGCYYYFGDKMPYNATPTDQGIALKTTSDLLYGRTYDANRTAALGLPATMDGAAFKGSDGSYIYVLWAKTSTDLSETASATYSFPAAIVVNGTVSKKEWNFSQTNAATTLGSLNIPLSGTPAFFEIVAGVPGKAPVVNAGADQTITSPVNTVTLSGSATGSEVTDSIASYTWTLISGPSGGSFTAASSATTKVNGLVQGSYTFRLAVTDSQGATATDDVQVTVNAPSTKDTTIRIEAENWTSMNGVQTETVYDAGGGRNVGWIDQGDWMEYTITVPASGSYKISFRIATPNDGAQFQVKNADGAVLAAVNVPNTGAYQTWQTTSTTLTLSAGTQTIRLQSSAQPGWNINWLELTGGAATNQPPVANAGADQALTLPASSLTLNGSGTDADGTIASYAWAQVSGPAVSSFSSASAGSTIVTGLVQGTYTFRLTVTDNLGDTAADDVVVTVAPANHPPVAEAGPDQYITLPVNSITLHGSGSDDDGSIASYSWSKIAGPEQFILTNATSAQTAVSNLTQGVYSFRLEVVDNQGAISADTVQISVSAALPPPNKAPLASAGADQTITLPASSVQLNGTGTDSDGTISSYQWSKISGPAAYNLSAPSVASATVNGLVEGTYQFELSVTDNLGAIGKDTVLVVVNPAPNQPPVATAGADQTITLPTSTVALNGSGADADGTIVSYSWHKISGPQPFVLSSSVLSSVTLSGLAEGSYQFELTVTDNQGAAGKDTVTIVVNPAPNQAPVVNAGSDISITLPVNTVTLSGNATDADGSVQSYQWTRVSGPASFSLTTPAMASTSATGLVEGVYIFRLTVTDNKGATASDDVQVTVKAALPPPDMAPVANAGPDQTIILPTNKVQLNGSGTDADGTITAYQWQKIEGPDSYQISAPTGAKTNLSGLVAGTYQFKLTVWDNAGASGADTVTVTVLPKTGRAKATASLYPNPATSSIYLQIDGTTDSGNSTLRIFNSAGTLMYQEAIIRTSHHTIKEVNISQFKKGTYVLSVAADIDTQISMKFIKQ